MIYELSLEDESILRYLKKKLKIDDSTDRLVEDTLFKKGRFYYKFQNGRSTYNIVVETTESTFDVGILCREEPIGVAYVTRNETGGFLKLRVCSNSRRVEVTKWAKNIYQYTYLLIYLSLVKDTLVVGDYKSCISKYKKGIRVNKNLEQIVNHITL